jgi:hypothetical protein
VASGGWALWRITEKKEATLRELSDEVAEMSRAQTEAVTKVEAALVARDDAVEGLRDKAA